MSVGTGSIKRAVKAANSTEELKQEAGGNAETVTEEKESKSEGAKAAQKGRARESAPQKTATQKAVTQKTATKKDAGKKTTAKKSAAPKVSDPNAADEKKSAAPAGYEAYGVGQELPVYLM